MKNINFLNRRSTLTKKLILIIVLIAFTFQYAEAQTPKYNLQFVEITNDGITGGDYDVLIQIKAEDVSFELGNANLGFNFNEFGLENPVLLTAHNFTSVPYLDMTFTEPIGDNQGIGSVNIVLTENQSSSAVIIGTTNWIDVATIRFSIIDPLEFSGFSWREDEEIAADGYIVPIVIYVYDNDTRVEKGGTLTDLNAPLPVEFIEFIAMAEGNSVILNWSTASERNNQGFYIERSANDGIWRNVGFVDGNGNATSISHYDHTDFNVFNPADMAATYYYRLKQVDFDGTYEYSDIRIVKFESNEAISGLTANVYPNPASDILNISIQNSLEGKKMRLQFYSLEGRIVNEVELSGFYTSTDISQMLNGIYQLIIVDDNNTILYNSGITIN